MGAYTYANAPMYNQQLAQKAGGLEIASLILGIASVVICGCCGCFGFGFMSIFIGIGAIICACIGKSKSGRFFGIGVAGLVLGIIGIVLGLMYLALIFIALSSYELSFSEFMQLIESGEFDKYIEEFEREFDAAAIIPAIRIALGI